MRKDLVGKEVFWLGSLAIVVVDPQRTDLVESLQGELAFCGVFPGPAAMYGTVKEVDENGDIKVRFLTAMGADGGAESDNSAYNFEIPKGMYIVVSRAR